MATKASSFLILAAVFCMLTLATQIATAQTNEAAALKIEAKALSDAQKLTEALPLYERLVQLTPQDPEVQMNLAFSLLGQAANTTDIYARKQLRIRARAAFVKAKELGDKPQLVLGMIEGLAPDGSDSSGFSDNAEANKLMEKGEAAFSSGKMDEALAHYQNALKMDPHCYHAALFSGDVNMHKEDFAAAETWYQKAISIDPYVETAYRYSATPFMKQKKYDQARDRYVEAFIVDPYGRLSISGIIQWAESTSTSLGHPKIDIPKLEIGSDGKTNTTVNTNPLNEDGSMAWMSYVTTREAWRKEKFAKQFPKEKAYRHSLFEEADALRSVVSMAKSLKPKKLNEQIALLAKIDQDGMLEAYVLMAIPDAGIARDHRAYLSAHRDKLRQYVASYVIGKK